MAPALEASQLAKRYFRTWALKDCTFNVPEGSIAALVGPNGAGKSTLLRMAAGLSRPSGGDLSVFGRTPWSRDPAALAQVGYLDQERPLYRWYRVSEILELGRRMNPRWDQTLAIGAIEAFGVPLRRRVGSLSVGQHGQVAAVVCMAKCPDLLLLDEPAAALDPLARRLLMEQLMQQVADRNTTVVFASHVISELEAVCDYVVILADARVQVSTGLEELRATHRLLVGPRANGNEVPALPAGAAVVSATHTGRQSTLVVRGTVGAVEGFQVLEPTLEEIVLAYLSVGSSSGGPPNGRTER